MIAPPYSPPKLVSRAASIVEPAGAGTVLVQVQVNADGTFKVLRVVRSTNNGDNPAALDIAARSKYAPARSGGKPVRSLFDFQVVFGNGAVSGAGAQIAAMLHDDNFSGAKDAAMQVLAQNPKNQLVQAQLGVAQAFLHDIPAAVSAFDRAGRIPDVYQSVAMQAYSLSATALAAEDPKTAVLQAQKAVALNGDSGAYYALGVAEQANKDLAAAAAALQKAREMGALEHPPASAQTVASIDYALLTVAQARNDTPAEQQAMADLNKLDPEFSGKMAAYTLDVKATDLANRHDYEGAIRTYERAAAADPSWAAGTEYTKAAIVLAGESNYQGARVEAEKAIAAAPTFAMGYYVAAVAMGEDSLSSGNMDELQRATEYAYKAADLADQAGQGKLAASARYFAKYHALDANLQFWSTQLSVNPTAAPPGAVVVPKLPQGPAIR